MTQSLCEVVDRHLLLRLVFSNAMLYILSQQVSGFLMKKISPEMLSQERDARVSDDPWDTNGIPRLPIADDAFVQIGDEPKRAKRPTRYACRLWRNYPSIMLAVGPRACRQRAQTYMKNDP